MSLELKKQAGQMRGEVFRRMLESRKRKYSSFLFFLRLFKFVSFAPIRGEFLESYYAMMRLLDDIVDGDASLPPGYANEFDYIQDKIKFAEDPKEAKDNVDKLMIYCFELGRLMGKNFESETLDILKSLRFDALRRRKMIIYPHDELEHHFYMMDIRGTIRATLKIFNEDPDKYILLKPLGMACRYQSDIEDFRDDIKAGYINISIEECSQFGIAEKDLVNHSTGVRNWTTTRAQTGLELLSQHKQNLAKEEFSLITKLTFRLVYELPARRAFREVLKKNLENRHDKKRY